MTDFMLADVLGVDALHHAEHYTPLPTIRRDLNDDGKVDLQTEDRNHDGNPDRFTYDLNSDGHVDLVKQDTNFDGVIDDIYRY